MRESKIEKYLHDEVTKTGRGTTRKWKSPGRRAVPDRIVIWAAGQGMRVKDGSFTCVARPATIHFVEMKAPKKGPRPEQAREHERLRDLGCVVLVLNTKAKVDAYVKACT